MFDKCGKSMAIIYLHLYGFHMNVNIGPGVPLHQGLKGDCHLSRWKLEVWKFEMMKSVSLTDKYELTNQSMNVRMIK